MLKRWKRCYTTSIFALIFCEILEEGIWHRGLKKPKNDKI